MIFVERIETVLPCLVDPWKLRIIAHLNRAPDLKELADILNARTRKASVLYSYVPEGVRLISSQAGK